VSVSDRAREGAEGRVVDSFASKTDLNVPLFWPKKLNGLGAEEYSATGFSYSYLEAYLGK
jgi:hypothetical protein